MRTPLFRSESGVIHHLGLIVFAIALVGVIGFAVFRIQANENDPNFTNDETALTTEDQTQAEIDNVADESAASVDEANKDLDTVTNAQEENDEN